MAAAHGLSLCPRIKTSKRCCRQFVECIILFEIQSNNTDCMPHAVNVSEKNYGESFHNQYIALQHCNARSCGETQEKQMTNALCTLCMNYMFIHVCMCRCMYVNLYCTYVNIQTGHHRGRHHLIQLYSHSHTHYSDFFVSTFLLSVPGHHINHFHVV